MQPLEGEIFLIDKPLGWTSFNVVKRLRGALLTRLRPCGVRKLKVGHAGTLDPLASGLMLVCTGRATKEIDALQGGVKEYIATLKLGATTPSFDLETPEDGQFPINHITEELVRETLKKFKGHIEQVPPSFSAVNVDGKRAYQIARKGDVPELKPKLLVIDEIELLKFSPNEITLRIVCSKGTYIRALARDIGQALNSGAYLTALRRTRIGKFNVEEALQVEEAARNILEKPAEIPSPENPEERMSVPPLVYKEPSNPNGANILPHYLRNH